MYKNITKLFMLALTITISSASSATAIYNYERGAGVFGGNSQLSYDSVSASFNTGTNAFSFEVDYNGTAADGGWLVVSPGPNPKNSDSELGIAYFDAASGDAWIYAYNGLNNNASYQTMQFLAYFSGAYTMAGDVATLAFDASAINSVLDTGFAFGDRIGIWFHPSANLNAFGTSDGLFNFNAQQNGWLDTNNDGDCTNQNTGCITTVPEPSTWLLLLVGFALLLWSRQKNAAQTAKHYAALSARIDRQLNTAR